jgi:hypothetical protein
VTAVVVLAGLAGCGAGKPTASATPQSATPSPSTAQATPPPTLPAQARQRTAQGAASFAGYWWQVVDRAYQQMDVAGLRAFALPACATCVRLIDGTERDRSVGVRYAGGRISMQAVRTVAANRTGIWLRTTVAQQPLRIADAAGTVVRSTKAQTTRFVLGLVWTGAGWRVAAMEVER